MGLIQPVTREIETPIDASWQLQFRGKGARRARALTTTAETIETFLATEKVIRGKVRWEQKAHGDYRHAALQTIVRSHPEYNGRLIMTAHTHRLPQKLGFALLVGSEAALRLDVNPGMTHFDSVSLISVSGTHWQPWPGNEAIPDARSFNHLGWLNEFLKKANIKWEAVYVSPPFIGGVQLGFEKQ